MGAARYVESEQLPVVFRIQNPGYTPSKNSVSFTVSWFKPGSSEVLFSTTGWRVHRGDVIAPSMKSKEGNYKPTSYMSPHLLKIVKNMVGAWEKEFPMTEFPHKEET